MQAAGLSVVTGAFGFTGRYIAQRLLSMGIPVKTLTGRPRDPGSLGDRMSVAPLDFASPAGLARSLEGAEVLYNTYWIRFQRGRATYARAVEHTRRLIKAAEEAGVRRVVHISIAGASANSPLPYFRGKGLAEEIVIGSGMSYAIVRPTVIFGSGALMINNIAWFLRRFPVFAIPGDGNYRLQPVFVGDVAEVAVAAGQGADSVAMDGAGPEAFTFEEMVRLIADKVGSRARLVHAGPGLLLPLLRLVGCTVRDVVLTSDEVRGLMASLLVSQERPAGRTRLGDWLAENSATVGARYISELKLHYRRRRPLESVAKPISRMWV